jgi:glyoxylate/hydroxypyruvate reductase A
MHARTSSNCGRAALPSFRRLRGNQAEQRLSDGEIIIGMTVQRSRTIKMEKSMALLVTPIFAPADEWRRAFAKELPDIEIRVWPEVGDKRDITVAAVARLPDGELGTFPNLKLIASLLAGQDLLLSDPKLPDVPIVRTGDPNGDELMTETALLHVLRHHCDLPNYQVAQQRSDWQPLPRRRASERQVGVLGLGSIGLAVARALAAHGFKVAGWIRHVRGVPNIEIFAGPDRLKDFLARSEIVVNLLPLTLETRDILNHETFAQLPRGAAVINIGRGATLVDDDLIAALDSGQLSAATLDVFRQEPLPKQHPFWKHPLITITPHVSRRLDAAGIVARIADNVRRLRKNQPLVSLVDRQAGY